jgi:hypothetical protein
MRINFQDSLEKLKKEINHIATHFEKFEIGITYQRDYIAESPGYHSYDILHTTTSKREAEDLTKEVLQIASFFPKKCTNKNLLRFEDLVEAESGYYSIFIRY